MWSSEIRDYRQVPSLHWGGVAVARLQKCSENGVKRDLPRGSFGLAKQKYEGGVPASIVEVQLRSSSL